MATATYSDARTKRETYERTRASALLERSSFEAHWRDLGDYILPRRTRFFVSDRNKGDRRSQKIIDSTATFAARTLRSGLHAGITSPSRPWMRLTTPDPELAEFGPVKAWLHIVTQRMLTVFLRSNLYNALPIIYGDLGVFGTAAMAVLDDDHDLMRCYAYPLGSFALGVSRRQVVDTCIREYAMTVRQVVEEFGLDVVSRTVRDLYTRGSYEQTVEVCWIVAPNPEADPEKLDAKYFPFHSCWFEKGNEDGFLRESGFREFPILGPRWDLTGEDVYGTDCPGMTCLGDVRALQVMQRRKAQAVEKMVNPPIQGPSHLKNQKVSLLPGDFTPNDVLQQGQGIRPIHEISMSVADLTADINETRFMIRRAFYEDLFLMLASTDRREITAREIDERHEEKLLALGPVLERMNDELLDPLVDRVYAMMDRAGLIPPPPQELEGVSLKVEYISLMAQAQKMVGVVGLDRFFRSTVPLIEAFPQMRHKIDAMQAVDEYGDALGVNPKLVVPDEEAEGALQAEQQAIAQQAQAERAAMMAKGAKELSQAPMDQDSALRRVLEGVQQ